MKRGRKNVYESHNVKSMQEILCGGMEITSRTAQGKFYQYSIIRLLTKAASENQELKFIVNMDSEKQKVKKHPEILEQLGRMLYQDGFSKSVVLEAAKTSGLFLDVGFKVKEVKAYLVEVRKTKNLMNDKFLLKIE